MLLNGDNNQELYRGKVETVSRPDVQKVYPKAPISENGGFKASIPVDRLNNASFRSASFHVILMMPTVK